MYISIRKYRHICTCRITDEGGCGSRGEQACVFEQRIACGSQGEHSSLASWQGQRNDAQEGASALGRQMLCGRRKEEDYQLILRVDGP